MSPRFAGPRFTNPSPVFFFFFFQALCSTIPSLVDKSSPVQSFPFFYDDVISFPALFSLPQRKSFAFARTAI